MYKTEKQYRLRGFDYSSCGYYFVTICVDKFKWWLGKVVDGEMRLSRMGEIVKKCWEEIPDHFDNVELDERVIMPNHIHGIIIIKDGNYLPDLNLLKSQNRFAVACRNEACLVPTTKPTRIKNQPSYQFNEKQLFYSSISLKPKSLSSIIGSFKSAVSKTCNESNLSHFRWQPRFHDHIIRLEPELIYIRRYIRYNPPRWQHDILYEKNIKDNCI